jgi:hypothetical protein
MEHAIFKCIVEVLNQSDCDKLREVCERYELPMWKDIDRAFDYVDYEDEDKYTYLKYDSREDASDDDHVGFYIDSVDDEDEYDIVSFEKFESLADDYNPQYKSVDDILTKLKELNNLLNNK